MLDAGGCFDVRKQFIVPGKERLHEPNLLHALVGGKRRVGGLIDHWSKRVDHRLVFLDVVLNLVHLFAPAFD